MTDATLQERLRYAARLKPTDPRAELLIEAADKLDAVMRLAEETIERNAWSALQQIRAALASQQAGGARISCGECLGTGHIVPGSGCTACNSTGLVSLDEPAPGGGEGT